VWVIGLEDWVCGERGDGGAWRYTIQNSQPAFTGDKSVCGCQAGGLGMRSARAWGSVEVYDSNSKPVYTEDGSV
jgi:hypothetical protein